MFVNAYNSLTWPRVYCPAFTLVSTVGALFAEKAHRNDFGKKKMAGVVVLNGLLTLAQVNTTSEKVRNLVTLTALFLSGLSIFHTVYVQNHQEEKVSFEAFFDDEDNGKVRKYIEKNGVKLPDFRALIDAYGQMKCGEEKLDKKFEEIFNEMYAKADKKLLNELNYSILCYLLKATGERNSVQFYNYFNKLSKEFQPDWKNRLIARAALNATSSDHFKNWPVSSFKNFIERNNIDLNDVLSKKDTLFYLLPRRTDNDGQIFANYLSLLKLFKEKLTEERMEELKTYKLCGQSLDDIAKERGRTREERRRIEETLSR